MCDSITTEEELHVGTKAISSILSQQASFAAPVNSTNDYESIGSYGDESPLSTMTLAPTLDSGEYESIEEWSAPITTNTRPTIPVTLISASTVFNSVEPLTITELRCRHEHSEEKKEKKRLKKEKKRREKEERKQRERMGMTTLFNSQKESVEALLSSPVFKSNQLPPLIPIQKEMTPLSSPAFGSNQLPPLIPIQKKTSLLSSPAFKSTLTGEASLSTNQLPPLIPIKKSVTLGATANNDPSFPVLVPFNTKCRLSNAKKTPPKPTTMPMKTMVLPPLVPLKKSVTPSSNTFGNQLEINSASLPPLIPLANRGRVSTLNSVKETVGASFFNATTATPFGKSLGTMNKYDVGCAYHGDPLKCPRSFIEKERPDLYRLWSAYNTMPVITASEPLLFVIPSKNALERSIASFGGDEGLIRSYLQSHMVRLDDARLLMSSRNGESYPTKLPSFRVRMGFDGNLFVEVAEGRIMLTKTAHKQVLSFAGDDDYVPPSGLDATMTMDGLLGNIKKKVLAKTGINKAPLVRKYEDMSYMGVSNSDTALQSYEKSDPKGEIKVKIETYNEINRADYTLKDSKPRTVYDKKVSVIRSGSIKSPQTYYSFIVTLGSPSVGLHTLYDHGVSISLANTVSSIAVKKSKSSDSGFRDVRLPVKLKNTPLLIAFDKSTTAQLMSEVDGTKDYIWFRTTEIRGDLKGEYQLLFRRDGPCVIGTNFDPSRDSCGYTLYHIVMNFRKEQLFQGLDYNTSFFSSSASELTNESFDASSSSSSSSHKKGTHKKATYSRLVYMSDEKDPGVPANTIGMKSSFKLGIYGKVDRAKHSIKKMEKELVINETIYHIETVKNKTHTYYVDLSGNSIPLSDIIDKGVSFTQETNIQPTPLSKGVFFAFSQGVDRDRLKAHIQEAADRVKRTRDNSIVDQIVFKADGNELPGGVGSYYMIFNSFGGCSIANSSATLGQCEYVLARIKMVFTSSELSMGSGNLQIAVTTPQSMNIEDCLFDEALSRGTNLSLALSSVATHNFRDFQSMNGASRLMTALSEKVKSNISEMGGSPDRVTTSDTTTKTYNTESLGTSLYEMNRTHLPLRKTNINENAESILKSLSERIGLEKMSNSEKLRVLSNLNSAIDVFSQCINDIVV